MKEEVLHLVICILTYFQPALADSKVVWVKDMTTTFETNKRTRCDVDLLDDLTFRLSYKSHLLTLNLKKSHGINLNSDIYDVHTLQNGRSLLEQIPLSENENVANYQNRENNAAMIVRCSKGNNGQYERVINGNIRLGDRNYVIRPAETDIKLRHLDVSDLLGTPYILHEQSRIRTDISAKNIDKKNKVRSTYWVEIAVLIDSTVWDFFSRLVETNDVEDQDALVQRKIREAFSLYIHGVDLLYSEIDDPMLEISITLRTFVFLKTDEFKHEHSKVRTHKGRTYIDSHQFLKDLKQWDRTIGSKSEIQYDHAMLFTRHDLFKGRIKNNEYSGVSYRGHVCEDGKRISIIEMGDFFTTVTNAAHELGHNLGAFHDGDRDAKDCDPDDEFIMAPENKIFNEHETYSRNPWLFSNCSIESFKKILQNKTCVTNKGVFYNDTEWINNVKKEAGEVYTLNNQCALVNGPNSAFCGAVSPTICLFMKCTDPKTEQCMETHFSAARGTKCGPYMWCIEGMCVAKDLK